MINNLRKKIFWTVVIVPLVIVFLVLTIYNYSYVSYVLYDETKTINYCVKSLKNNQISFVLGLKISIGLQPIIE